MVTFKTYLMVSVVAGTAAACGGPLSARGASSELHNPEGPAPCQVVAVGDAKVCVPTASGWAAFSAPFTMGDKMSYFGNVTGQWALTSFGKIDAPPKGWVVHPPAQFVSSVIAKSEMHECIARLKAKPEARCSYSSSDGSMKLFISSAGVAEMYIMIDAAAASFQPRSPKQ